MIAVSKDEVFDEKDAVIYSTVTDEKYAYGLNVDTKKPENEYAESERKCVCVFPMMVFTGEYRALTMRRQESRANRRMMKREL